MSTRKLDRVPNNARHPISGPRQILRLPDVIALTGMKRSWIYREARAGRFPAPTKLNQGAASGWDAAAVQRWIAAQFSGAADPATTSGAAAD